MFGGIKLTPEEKIREAIKHCEKALELLKKGNKRLAVGNLDHSHDLIIGSKMLLINEIIEKEGKL